jgi:CheY-like chemotaxis protein
MHDCEAVVVDLNMPKMNPGISLISYIREIQPSLPITSSLPESATEEDRMHAALRAGQSWLRRGKRYRCPEQALRVLSRSPRTWATCTAWVLAPDASPSSAPPNDLLTGAAPGGVRASPPAKRSAPLALAVSLQVVTCRTTRWKRSAYLLASRSMIESAVCRRANENLDFAGFCWRDSRAAAIEDHTTLVAQS